MRYFITFTCYGGRLHGDESGSVDRHHNLVGSRLLQPDPQRVVGERQRMLQEPYVLDQKGRAVALRATQWLWKDADVRNAIQYVVQEQGEPLALFVAGDL